jgi:signal transduction histidine kinase
MARARPAGRRAKASEREVPGNAAEEALGAAKQELERMNQILEQRVLELTAALGAEAMRRAEAESHLHQAQKLEAVGQLAGGIAHDFNNILQVILGSLEIITITLKRGPLDDPGSDRRAQVERVMATARRAALSAKQLVERLLAFSRQQPLAPRVFDVNGLVGDMTDMIGRTLGETIHLETPRVPEPCPVYADRNRLESVLLNLVVNARDAMPRGGRLRIQTANDDLRGDSPDDLVPGRYVTLSVSDTGCGIPREDLDRVFEPFFTTKDAGKGSGLGLAIVHGFVKQSGGHIRIHSDVGAGTTINIYLPRSERDEDGLLRGHAPDGR